MGLDQIRVPLTIVRVYKLHIYSVTISQISVHGSRPVEGRLKRVQHCDVDLAGLARLLDEDGAEEEENVEPTVLGSRLDDHFQRLLHVLQPERNSVSHAHEHRKYAVATVARSSNLVIKL